MKKIEFHDRRKYKFTKETYEWFKDRVKQRNMTLTQAAEQLGMSIQRLSDIINGRVWISEKVLMKINLWEEKKQCEKPMRN